MSRTTLAVTGGIAFWLAAAWWAYFDRITILSALALAYFVWVTYRLIEDHYGEL